MNVFSRFLICVFSLGLCVLPLPGAAYEVSMITAAGERCVWEFQPEEPMCSVVEVIRACYGEDAEGQSVRLEILGGDEGFAVKASIGEKRVPRNYYAFVSPEEKKEIAYILKTLANSSLAKITKQKSSLKKAGDRIEHLHPFKFLETIFTDEELKVCIRNIEGKSWVWSEFRDPLIDSLEKESSAGNIRQEYVQNLAATVNIDAGAISPMVNNKEWSKLISSLIDLVPRSGDSNRYNQ